MPAIQCHHLHLMCADLEAMIDFWTRGCGAKLEERREFTGAPGAVLDIGLPMKLYLKSVPLPRADSVPGAAGMEHLGFLVESLDGTVEHLLTIPGVSVARPPFTAGSRRGCFVKGPEGILVEIMEDVSA